MKLSNPKIKAALVDTPGAIDALLAIGWMQEHEPEEALAVPKGRHFTMAEVSQGSMVSSCSPLGLQDMQDYMQDSPLWPVQKAGSRSASYMIKQRAPKMAVSKVCLLPIKGGVASDCVLPYCTAYTSMCRQVRMIDDAAERLRKRQKDEARASSAQQRTAASSAAAQVRAQV